MWSGSTASPEYTTAMVPCPCVCLLLLLLQSCFKHYDDLSIIVLNTNDLENKTEIVSYKCVIVSRTTALDETPPVFLFVKRMLVAYCTKTWKE